MTRAGVRALTRRELTRREVLRNATAATFAVGGVCAMPARAATKLTVAKVAEDFALMMGDFGAKLGIHQRNGLDLDFVLITQAKMVQALVAGSIDLALASGATLAFAAKGAPLKAVAALSGPPAILVLVVRPDNSVTSLDQLRGRTAAVTNAGSLTDWAVSQIAVSRGWSLGEIKRVAVGDTPARVATLKTREVDAAVIDIAAALDLEEERGEAKILLNFGDLIPTFQNQIIFASDQIIKDRPEAENLVGLYSALSGRTEADVLKEYGGQGFGQSFKPALADLLIETLSPMAAEMAKYAADPAEIDRVLAAGAEKACALAEPVIAETKRLVGFWSAKA